MGGAGTGWSGLRAPLAILGCGRAGTALALRAAEAGWPVLALWDRAPARAAGLAARVGARPAADPASAARAAVLVGVAVADRAVAPLVEAVAAAGGWRPGQVAFHLSGALGLEVLAPARAAGAAACACHPLVAIADPEHADFTGVRFLLEGDPGGRAAVEALVGALGGVALSAEGPLARPLYHAAAAVAGNLSVALAALAADLLVQAGLPPAGALPALVPLLRSVVANLERLGLPAALTGPVVRGDAGTVAAHLSALAPHPEALQAYRLLGRVALELARRAGLPEEAAAPIAGLLEEGAAAAREAPAPRGGGGQGGRHGPGGDGP